MTERSRGTCCFARSEQNRACALQYLQALRYEITGAYSVTKKAQSAAAQYFDNRAAATIIEVTDDVQYQASAPDDYRGFRIFESDWVDSPAPHDPFDRLD